MSSRNNEKVPFAKKYFMRMGCSNGLVVLTVYNQWFALGKMISLAMLMLFQDLSLCFEDQTHLGGNVL